jgi:hypothetical protein
MRPADAGDPLFYALYGKREDILALLDHCLLRIAPRTVGVLFWSKVPRVRPERLPRMADFALWSTACETAFWPAGTFWRTYEANRRAAIESVVEADVVAARVREIMPDQADRKCVLPSARRCGCSGNDLTRWSPG